MALRAPSSPPDGLASALLNRQSYADTTCSRIALLKGNERADRLWE